MNIIERLDYMRVDLLRDGKEYGLIVHCSFGGEAVKFYRDESVQTTVATLRNLADRLERRAGLETVPALMPDSLQVAPDRPDEVFAKCLSCGADGVMRGYARTCCAEGAEIDKDLGLTALNRGVNDAR